MDNTHIHVWAGKRSCFRPRGPARAAKPQAKTRPQRHEELCSAAREREGGGTVRLRGIQHASCRDDLTSPQKIKLPGISVITTRDSCDMSSAKSEGVASEEEEKSIVHCAFSTEHVHI